MFLATDVDGTLARRNEPISEVMAGALAAALRRIRGLAIISGQSAQNVISRVIAPLSSECTHAITVYSCEGACRWTVTRMGVKKDLAYSFGRDYSPLEQSSLSRALVRFLASASQRGIAEFSGPEFWDESMLVFKSHSAALDRIAFARALRTYLEREFGPSTPRVGIAGQTTIWVRRRGIDKAVALRDIAARVGVDEEVVYVADEFAPTGNDAPALRVQGISIVSVGNSMLSEENRTCHLGGGPEGTLAFLRSISDTTRRS